jgi:hypothetical protein
VTELAISTLDERVFRRRIVPMKKPAQQLVAEVPRRWAKVEPTASIGLGDVWSQAYLLGEVAIGDLTDEATVLIR